jgi:hypothetical protein
MKKPLISFIKDIRTSKKIFTFDEASIKQAVVLRLLSLLEWDIFNVEEICPDFSSDASTVSYALRIDHVGKMLLDVKRDHGGTDGLHKHLVDLAAREAFELCVHTNGPRWWFYLPSAKGGLSQKRCHVIDLIEQKPEDAAADLITFLSREKVAGGGHLEAAMAAHQHQKRKMAAEFLPEAWNKVMAGPNKILVEILSDATEELCGCKADPGVVEGFIRRHVTQWLLSDTAPNREEPPRRWEDAIPVAGPPAHPDKSSDIKGKKPEFFADKPINSFTFQGNTFSVTSWEQMLTTLCNHFAATHSQQFEKVLWMYDDQQPRFSRYSDQLRIPEKIRKTNIYVETKLAPEEIVKTVGDLLTEFGHGHEELVITTQ